MRDRRLQRSTSTAGMTNAGATAPGRSMRTSRLSRRANADGASPGAGTAVERAAGSQGAPLPAGVKDRFESSLGTDLSAVRVHTGDASAEAASAVGAHAYATGQDIHFADGAYAPGDRDGLHLLAHEVAHTVQQAGAAPTTQYQLEVSSPGDAAELEADRAADAMISGAPAQVTGASAAIARDAAPPATAMDHGFSDSFKFAEVPIGKIHLGPYFEAETTFGASVDFSASKAKPAGPPAPPTPAAPPAAATGDDKADAKKSFHDWVDAELAKIGANPIQASTDIMLGADKNSLSVGGGLNLTTGFGPIKATITPISVSLLTLDATKGVQGPKLSTSAAISAAVHKDLHGYTFEGALTGTLELALKPDWAAIAEYVAEELGVAGVADLAIGLAPVAALSFGIMLGLSSAIDMGARDAALIDSAKDAYDAGTAYGVMMSGGDTAFCGLGGGKAQLAAEARARADIARLAGLAKVSPAVMKNALHDRPDGVQTIVAAQAAAKDQLIGDTDAYMKRWRSDHAWESVATTEFVDLADARKLVTGAFGPRGA